jgi:glyoxylase-like metal-dependent hydrolase (beta-lactamase superfamily II)
MELETFFDPATYTLTYVVFDPESRDAVVIDPVLDYDPAGSRTSTRSVEQLAAFLRDGSLRVHYVLETHAHADHLSASQWLKRRFEAKVAIGARITEVQRTFQGVFDLPASFAADGSQFDELLADGQVVQAGTLRIEVLATPGHTPACLTYKIDDAVFTGDALFIEDYGTGRCDFPAGSADELYRSVHDKLYALPDATRVFVGHDYQPGGREVRSETTIGASKRHNIQLRGDTSQEEFVTFRKARDKTLAAPRLLLPSVQVNIDAGRLPRPHDNGMRYLAIPINLGGRVDEDGSVPPR